MAEFSIESNGRIEMTAVYYNGEQLAGVREVMLNLDENGTFDGVVRYLGSDGDEHSKQIFSEYLENSQTREPAFTEEEARSLRLLTVESDGDIENTHVWIDQQEQFGIVSLFIHIKAPSGTSEPPEFRAEVTYRNDDGTHSTEGVF